MSGPRKTVPISVTCENRGDWKRGELLHFDGETEAEKPPKHCLPAKFAPAHIDGIVALLSKDEKGTGHLKTSLTYLLGPKRIQKLQGKIYGKP